MKSKIRLIGKSKVEILNDPNSPMDTRLTLIQMLIPLGLKAVEEELQREVESLAGTRYSHADDEHVRWGVNRGSVYLGDQKVEIAVPRVRKKNGGERPLKSYEGLQAPSIIENKILKSVMFGLSQHRYKDAAIKVAETFGVSASSVSRKFVRATSKKLEEMMCRDLSGEDIIAIFMDGKRFADTGMIVCVGVTINGEKKILGFIESGTENTKVIEEFLNNLIERGLKTENEILFVIDGAKGLRKGIETVMGNKAVVQRCQFHKAENVASYLPKKHQAEMKIKLRRAYACENYDGAKRQLEKIKKELKLMNQSALASLEEGFEETLTLHRLGVFKEIGVSFKTTNCIESILSQVAQFTDRVDYWKNSGQRQRWLASALIEIEKTLRKVKGHKHLLTLRQAMKRFSEVEVKKCA